MFIYGKFQNKDEFNLLNNRFDEIFFETLFFLLIQICLVFIWYLLRFDIIYWLNYYDSDENNFYIIPKISNDDHLNENNFNEVKKIFHEENSNYLVAKNHKITLKIQLILNSLFFNSQMISITFCLILNILYLLTNYKMFIVIQILAVINMYSLFEYFLQAIYNKYKQFVSLLIFIYCIEYIFSWIAFLHFQEFMITDYINRSGDLNKDVNFDYYFFFIIIFFYTIYWFKIILRVLMNFSARLQ